MLVTLPSPISELHHTLLPLKVLWAKECALTLCFSVVFNLDSHLNPLRSLGVRHYLYSLPFSQKYYKHPLYSSFFHHLLRLIILFLSTKVVGTSILKIWIKNYHWPLEGSIAWWPLKGSNVWWPLEGSNAWWPLKGSNVWWPLKGSNA
jgi:hypothetical protein